MSEQKLILYFTSVSSSAKIKKDQQNLEWLLQKKGCVFDRIDVAQDVSARTAMRIRSNRTTLPQLFMGETFIGDYDDCVDFEEGGELDKKLGK